MSTLLIPAIARLEGETWLFILIPVAFLIVFPLIWCGVIKLMSLVSGWAALARPFAAGDRPVTGEEHQRVTAMLGVVSYKRCLTLHLAADGLFIETWRLLSIGHPRLFIPWSAMRKDKPVRVFWLKFQRYTIGSPVITTVTLPAALLDRMPVA